MKLALVLIAALVAPVAAAPALSPITDRDYAIELYDGVALGSTAIIGMGGAATADAIGTAGTLVNPSAMAVRRTTDTDSWTWDYHVDYLDAALSNDYANSGLPPTEGGEKIFTAGLGARVHDWALAATVTDVYAPVADTGLTAQAIHMQVAASRWIAPIDLAVGVSVQGAWLTLTTDQNRAMFTISGMGLGAGATWIPRMRDFRIGAAIASPIVGGHLNTVSCDPMNCDGGYILPERLVTPWRVSFGGAYRFARTAWNQPVGGWFRDERALTLAADLVIAGSSPDAYGLQAFGDKELERAGSTIAWSPRLGAEYEWLPGRLRVRAGGYWEPGRYDGVGGRLHGTFGAEVRVLQFWFWGARRRGSVSLTADVASLYRNIGLSVGFWH